MSAPQGQAPGDRKFYLDNLKVFLTALVICHHLSIAFGASGGWYYHVPQEPGMVTTFALTMFTAVNQAFFMSLFFLVSAYFTPQSCDKKGAGIFLRDRFKRLGIPLLVYYFLLNPVVVCLSEHFRGEIEGPFLPFLWRNLLRFPGPGPLWFVLSLLMFAVAYVAIRQLSHPVKEGAEPRPLPTNRQLLVFIVVVSAVTFAVRLAYPTGTGFLGLQFGYFPLYICCYAAGIAAYRWSWLEQLTVRQANRWFHVSLVLIALIPLIMLLGGAVSGGVDAFKGGLSWQAYAYAAWEPFICIGISMKLLVVFRARLNTTSRLKGMLSKSAYTAYIIHPFFVVIISGLVRDVPLPLLVRFLVLVPVVLVPCFLVSDLVRQLPLLRRIL